MDIYSTCYAQQSIYISNKHRTSDVVLKMASCVNSHAIFYETVKQG
jgi:hypothetical protein